MLQENNTSLLKKFIPAQAARWNACDKESFFSLYRQIAPKLVIEYVGQALRDPWTELEAMWEGHNAKIQIEILSLLGTGDEAACHNRNKIIGTDMAIDTIETYKLAAQTLTVRIYRAS